MEKSGVRDGVALVPVLRAMSPGTMAALLPCAVYKRFPKGTQLFWEKDEAKTVYFLTEGFAALYKLNERHEKKVLSIHGGGAMLNEAMLDGGPASVNCELLSESRVLSFGRQQFLYSCEHDFGLAKAVMDSMAQKIRRQYRQLKNTGVGVRGAGRMASKLWKLSGDHGLPCPQGTMIAFDLTITYLADILGTKRETASRQLKTLTEQGLVVFQRNRFIIPNREKLRRFATVDG